MSTHALASITATYTDSEPEGDDDGEVETEEGKKSGSDNEDPPKEEKDSQPDPASTNANPGAAVSSNTVTSTVGGGTAATTTSTANSITSNVVNQEITLKVAKLVSYNDDAIVSDDEFDIYNHKIQEGGGELKSSGPGGDVELPPEPTGRCSPRLMEKVTKLHEKIASGLDMNNLIQCRKDFRNPSIYEKLIQFCELNELGTNYPAGVYDPLIWGKESYYEELAKVQKVEMDRREKEKKERTKVEFVSGTKKPSGAGTEEEQKKRKSKWDQVGAAPAGAGGISLGVIRPAGLLQASLTSSVTGTKSTIISAFGSLPKKPRL